MSPDRPDRDRAGLVRRFATLAEQNAALDGGWRWFAVPGIGGAIPYRAHFGVAIVPGDPLCTETDLPRLLAHFLHTCRAARWYALFAPASARLAAIAPVAGCAVWKIGEEPIIDLRQWSLAGGRAASLRAALNHARRGGVAAEEVAQNVVLAELAAVDAAWRGHRRSPELGFVLAGSPLSARPGRRWFAARIGDEVVGFAVSAPLAGGEGVAIEHFVRRPGAPRGAVEAAVVAGLQAHADDGVTWATLGAAPFRGSEQQMLPTWADPRRRLGAEAMLLAWRRAALIYRSSPLEQFKRKFPADRWESLYAVNLPSAVRPRLGVGLALEALPGGPRVWLDAALTAAVKRLQQRAERR